ncbi:Uncharacterised protein [Bacteroides eggerthii]|uniref:Uncharacterized protein n=2 Tax=Bacteroides eggerthii TaxID=28111 RepID=A0A380YHT0_9BACE|nr:Uncharacterised protein [Bacteroides eggerthii]
MRCEEQKNRIMKTFEEIYRDVTERRGCNSGETFARAMFEEGMRQNLECCMDKAAGSYTDLMAFAGWFGNRLARESVRCNAARVSFPRILQLKGKIHHPVRDCDFQYRRKEEP